MATNIVGIGNSQVPTNAMLGGLAYEDCSVLHQVRSGRKNIIINGAMNVCQRFAVNSANNISNATHTYHVDRFKAYESTDGILQGEWINSDAPPNFHYSLFYHPATTDTSIANNQFAFISQVIELKNMRHLGYGGSYAKTCTLSFWVKSNLTGTYTISLINDGTNNRQFVTEYTINSTNTWEKKTITIPGDTGGTWNSNGLRIAWTLTSAGNRQTTTVGSWFDDSTTRYATNKQVSGFMSNTGNSFKLSGVQFEIGNYATDFEHRNYGDELRQCERYFEKHWQNNNSASPDGGGDGYNTVANGTHNGSNGYYVWRWRTQKRARPAISHAGKFRIFGGSSHSKQTVDEFYSPGVDAGRLRVNHSGSAGASYILEFDGANSSNGYIQADAELY